METETTIQLVKPVKIGEVEYAEVSLSEPTALQLSKAEKSGSAIDQLITLIHLNGKLPRAAVEQMRQRDLEKCGDFFGGINSAPLSTLAI